MSERVSLRQFWHVVARADSLAAGPQRVTLLDQQIVVFEADGKPVALNDLCIHRGAPLSRGRVIDGEIECPFHGWRYASDGHCTLIPALGAGRSIPTAACVPSFACEIRYGLVWVALDTPVAPIPSFPREVADHSLASDQWAAFRWGTSAGRAVENAMDLAHFPFVHAGILGDPNAPTEVAYEMRQLERGVEFVYGRAVQNDQGEVAPGSTRYEQEFPFTVHFVVDEPQRDGSRRVTAHTSFLTPHSSDETTMWRFVHRNYAPGEEELAELALFTKVLEEDREMLELVRPEQIPIDLREELHLRVPDAASLAFRRWLANVDLAESVAP